MKKVLKLFNLLNIKGSHMSIIIESLEDTIDYYDINFFNSWLSYFEYTKYNVKRDFIITYAGNTENKMFTLHNMECIYLLEIIKGNYFK